MKMENENQAQEKRTPRKPTLEIYTSADTSILSEHDAQVLGQEMETLQEDGIPVTPALIVLRAKDPLNPLHKHFEWNDSKAAQEHRKHQALTLIQTLQVVVVNEKGRRAVRSHFSVIREREEPPVQEYISVRKARSEPLAREQVYEKAVQELLEWTRRYEAFGLEELTPVYEVAAKFTK